MNRHRPKDKLFLWIALLFFSVAALVVLFGANRATAACARPVTETAVITSVYRSLPALYVGVGVNTRHGIAFHSWRKFQVGGRVTVAGCLEGSIVRVTRVY